eukprot:6491139-Prymnesium_polylepis.1
MAVAAAPALATAGSVAARQAQRRGGRAFQGQAQHRPATGAASRGRASRVTAQQRGPGSSCAAPCRRARATTAPLTGTEPPAQAGLTACSSACTRRCRIGYGGPTHQSRKGRSRQLCARWRGSLTRAPTASCCACRALWATSGRRRTTSGHSSCGH